MTKTLRYTILVVLNFIAVSVFPTEKIYKTEQDYLASKPYLEGRVSIEFQGFGKAIIKVKEENGQKTTINMNEIWGYETPTSYSYWDKAKKQNIYIPFTLLNRAVDGLIYKCISHGKFYVWVPVEHYIQMMEPGFITVTDPNRQEGELNPPKCYYSTSLNSEMIKMTNINKFFELITAQEKEAILAEIKRLHTWKYPHYAMQLYNKLYPVK